jgi:hypothetical protein
MRILRLFGVAACLALLPCTARAQGVPAPPSSSDGWHVTVYPLLVWVPLDLGIDVDVAPGDGSDGESATILESRFDGAYFGGAMATNGVWRIEGDGMWAAFGGDRADRPFLKVDLDVVYGNVKIGRRIAPDLFVTGGVRRVALKYDIIVADLPPLSRKPNVWDPLVGLGWHRVGKRVEWHGYFDVGGFGAGSDLDIGAGLRADWKPISHFGLTAGYNMLYLKLTDDKAARTVTIKPFAHGPALGFGLYF